ncbi:hypothetical protein BGW39_007173 [Mortierella sp. 14UC]|nr:hypothetical protein BGW39_007173 [Mortierella sp. 14UC]
MAVVPIPIKECTKTVFNEKLRRDCMNLDTGEKMCVSINPSGINPPLVPKAKEKPADAEPTKNKKTENKELKDGKAAGATSEAAKPADIQDKKPVVKTDVKKDTPSAPAAVSSAPAIGGSNAATASPNKLQQNTFANGVSASAVGTTSSMMLAVAGVVLSAVYIL